MEICKANNMLFSDLLREVIYFAIRENHEVVKKGMIQKIKGIDKI